jgi:hypothetical protein
MIRASFELKISASTMSEAKEVATTKIAAFLGIPVDQVIEQVGLEFKISYPEAKTYADIAQNMDSDELVVTVFGSLKQTVVKAFGQ